VVFAFVGSARCSEAAVRFRTKNKQQAKMAIEKVEGETPKPVVRISQTQLSCFSQFLAERIGRKQIKAVDMSESLQAAAIEIAQKAFEEHSVEKDIAQYIKKEFDR
jgi:dynein light chain LC8-type